MNCLRCGKTAEASFCPDCLKTVSLPLVESPYLNTHINLNAKRTARPAPKKTDSPEEKKHFHKGYVAAIVMLSLLCAVLLCACLWLGGKEIFLWLD